MVSFPNCKALLRALKKVATSTPPGTTEQKKMPYNLFIFPESLLDKSLAKGALARTYTPNELLQFILKYAVNSVGSIRVTSLSYYKETSKAQHEYLIIKVEDSKDNLSNFIKIDCCPSREESALPPRPSDDTTSMAPEGGPLATTHVFYTISAATR